MAEDYKGAPVGKFPATLKRSVRRVQTLYGKSKGMKPKGLKFHVWNR
jgi:hypothetical protein